MQVASLQQQIATSFGQDAASPRQQARLVDELAKALQQTAETASALRLPLLITTIRAASPSS